ncbi:MAG TPA: hypothetical protein VFB76_00630 [Candidatus Angelobacter sp.]|nr:hypothetical protein [Candidatus Angelobacter sp.]
MAKGFPAIMCFAGSIVFFALFIKLRTSATAEKLPASSAGIAAGESSKRAGTIVWLYFVLGFILLAAAIIFELIGLRA